MISFKPLLKTLIDKNLSKTEFVEMMKISSSTSAKMWRNEYIAMKIVDDICKKFECALTDVIEYVPDEQK
ncbi:helix-turn-helix domain-containing protein [Paenibacillus anseongense]|uniref:helix-turn-helix domain-containing protein n=1 Tax=Paenibacillus anseongense TaxID=2682845 RepID=UPI002DB9D5FB|nr:helix-turn-helix domain-containing protein [Paenibacillus anseongense]MEC0266711.1 helix-turn-helix domain-containing protein [Paenibacillus anseongense]